MKKNIPSLLTLLVLATMVPLARAAEPVWLSDQPFPKAAELSELKDARFHVINEPNKDDYKWLKGVALVWHKDKLYASFGNNKGTENTTGEEARGRISEDGGKTWGEPFSIATPDEPNLGISHGVFLSRGGELWAFQAVFHGSKLQDPASKVHTRAYLLNEATGVWEKKGTVIEGGFWPMQEPQKMDDGNWIMAGLRVSVSEGNPGAVAISHGDNLTKWDLVSIPRPGSLKMWGESAVIVNGKRVESFARTGTQPSSVLTAVSEDYGRTWTDYAPSNLPMVRSKPSGGRLSTGQPYLVCTTTAEAAANGQRAPLTIAVGRAGENGFRKIFRIRDAVWPQGPGYSGPKANLSYPYAVEHDGNLYIGYSCGNAELAVIPVKDLHVE